MKFKFPLLLLLSSLCNISHANPAKPQLVTNLFNQSNNFQVIENKENITVILPVKKFLWHKEEFVQKSKPAINKIDSKSKVADFIVDYREAGASQVKLPIIKTKVGIRYLSSYKMEISITDTQVKIDYSDPSNKHKIKVIELPKVSKLIEQAKVTWENNSTICAEPYLQVQIPKLKEKNEK